MIRLIITILGIILITGQAYCIPARAQVIEKNAETMADYEISLEQDTHEFVAQNHVVPGVAVYAQTFGLDQVNRLAKDGVIIGKNSADRYMDLVSGNILLNPEKDIVVATKEGKISIGSGAMAFVSASSHKLVVYDLMQTKPNQVSISVGKQRITVEPGRMLVVTNENTKNFEALDIDCHCVNYRNAVALNLNSQPFNAFMAEFSIASAMLNIQPLQRLTVSENTQDILTLQKMLKGAIVLGEFAMNTDPPAQSASAQAAAKVDSANDKICKRDEIIKGFTLDSQFEMTDSSRIINRQ